VLDELVAAVRTGASRALVLFGEPGVGKTALLDHVASHALGCRVARTAGTQPEIELPFAGVHQLCAPMLDRLDCLPAPQSDALRIVFGLRSGPPPDRFLVGLGVLGLLSEVAEQQPLICLIDDAQWIDFATALVLPFAARRLGEESVGLVFATRVSGGSLTGLPELAIDGLREADARALLDTVLPGKVDVRVRDQIVFEARGNPLALLELPRGLTPAELAVGFELLGSVPLEGNLEESFLRRLSALPHETQRLLLVAAAEPTGDPLLVWSAAARLGIGPEVAAAATEAGLAEFGTDVRFRHPLVRSAVYRAASAGERQQAHQALAEVTDPGLDPERKAWHRGQGAPGPDEEIATELESAARLALARGCLAAAGAYLERATRLTIDPARRSGRALVAAEGKIRLGSFDVAAELLAIAETDHVSELQRAQIDLIHAQLAFVTNRGNDATPLLLAAAKRLGPVDAELSRATYLDAFSAAIFAGRLADPGGGVLEVARLAATAPRPPHSPQVLDLLLDGLVASATEGYRVGSPILREALDDFGAGMSVEDELHWLWLKSVAALRVWEDDRWEAISTRHVQLARDTGALSELPLALLSRTYVLLFSGELGAAESLSDETLAINEAITSKLAPYGALGVAAFRGEEAETLALIETTLEDVKRRGEGVGITFAEWANAVLHNGLGKFDKAYAAAQRATAYDPDPGSLIWPAVELIEAAARTGATQTATRAYAGLSEMTKASGTNWALGLQARTYALLTDGKEAETLYREAIDHLGRTRMRADLARAHLLYGEWLRRQRRPTDAREQLRTAHRMFEAIGMKAFADRASSELRGAGEKVYKSSVAARHSELTAQEAQIARLAREGLSNPEIATRLFVSAHTVQYHLRKVFAKLGIASRTQLEQVLPPR
jgi:DNA-binding CsgD family transcriptional regulator